MSEGAECLFELADRPGCYIFNPYYNPAETATWSGACRDGVAVGQGTRGWECASGSGEATGTLARGKRHGRRWPLSNVSAYGTGRGVFIREDFWLIAVTEGASL